MWGRMQPADAGEEQGIVDATLFHVSTWPLGRHCSVGSRRQEVESGRVIFVWIIIAFGAVRAAARADPIIKPPPQSASGTPGFTVSNSQLSPPTRPSSHPVASAFSRVLTMSATRPNTLRL